LLGDLGGLLEALVYIATFLIAGIAKQFMLSHIMSEVFYISKQKDSLNLNKITPN